jgi:hypothetical protein
MQTVQQKHRAANPRHQNQSPETSTFHPAAWDKPLQSPFPQDALQLPVC